MTSPWTDEATLSGIRVKAVFFDGDALDREPEVVKRTLGFLPGIRATLLVSETDRQNFSLGDLIVQPDAVYCLGDGLLNLEYKSRSKRSLSEAQWQSEVHLEHMVQCLLCGLVLAQCYQRVVANILRYHNAAFFLQPPREVMQIAWDLIPLACQLHEEPRVGARQLARLASERVRRKYGSPADPRAAAGRAAHDAMFKRTVN